jgi:uncharacterized repeat protein (TIGR01451 family)
MLRRQFLKFLVFFASLGLVAAGLVGPATAARTSSQADFADRLARPARLRGLEPIVRTPTGFGVSRPLRDLPKVQRTDGSARAVETFRGALPRTADGAAGHSVDPVLQRTKAPSVIPGPNLTFEGMIDSENSPLLVAPPDSDGDVGPDHYVSMVNLIWSVYDKTGVRLAGPTNLNQIWVGGATPNCAANNSGDPIVLYDQLADRWLLSQFAVNIFTLQPPYYQCIAISQTADPTGTYFLYEFLYDEEDFNDYPKFGVWPDAYYMSVNQFRFPDFNFVGPGAVAYEREAMLAGDPLAQQVKFDLSSSLGPCYGGQLPTDLDGTTLPPAGSPNYFIEADDPEAFGCQAEFAQDQLSLFEFHVDWATPANSTFTGPTAIPTAAFDSNMCNFARACIPQKGVPANSYLDAISDRVMFRLAYRNFGTHEALVMNHTVDVGDFNDHAGVRWYELRDPGGTPAIFQQGTYAPDAEHRWMGSIAMDKRGDIAVGFSLSSSTRNPAIAYAGRLAGDPLGQMSQGEAIMYQGTGSQLGSGSRWGDYSAMTVDPVDDCTFWYISEYYTINNDFDWHTRVGSFTFPSCLAPAEADVSLTKTDEPDPVEVGADLVYTLVVTNNGPGTASGVVVKDQIPLRSTFESVETTQGNCSVSGRIVSCNLGTMTSGGDATITITVNPTQAGSIRNRAKVSIVDPADPVASNNVAKVRTTVVEPGSQQAGAGQAVNQRRV